MYMAINNKNELIKFTQAQNMNDANKELKERYTAEQIVKEEWEVFRN